MPPARWTSSICTSDLEGATLHRFGTRRLSRSMSAMVKGTPPSCAAASRCSTVLVEPPIAMSSDMAFSKASKLAMPRGRAVASSCSYQRRARSTISQPASTNSLRRSAWVASSEPLPGRARPSASVRQFIELAVNMPEHEPQVGQADRSISSVSAWLTRSSAAATMAVMRSARMRAPLTPAILPASIGPPETKTVGTLRRIEAISMPGVILSQLLMHTIASAQWALTMYSTLSAMSSREGRL